MGILMSEFFFDNTWACMWDMPTKSEFLDLDQYQEFEEDDRDTVIPEAPPTLRNIPVASDEDDNIPF